MFKTGVVPPNPLRAPAPRPTPPRTVPSPKSKSRSTGAAEAASETAPVGEAPKPLPQVPRSVTTPQAPELGKSSQLSVDEFSMTEPSWWREEQPTMVRDFTSGFVTEYGQSILGGVKARAQNNKDWAWQRDADGLVLGDDGRSAVLALRAIRDKVNAGTLQRSECCEPVLQAIDAGIWVTPVYYGTSDALHPVAWNTVAHSEENVKYLCSTVVDQIDLVLRLAKTFDPKTKWEDVTRYLGSLYGPNRRRDVGRWVKIAKTMPESVVAFLRERVKSRGMKHGVKSTCFCDNPFIVSPVAQGFQLPVDLLLTAVQAMYDSMDQGISVSAESFQTNFCQPALAVNSFRLKQQKKFKVWGADTELSSPWQQLMHSLIRDDAMRSQVAGCLAQSVSLEAIQPVKTMVIAMRKARDDERARQKSEKEAGLKALQDEAELVRARAHDAARTLEACTRDVKI